MLSKCKYLKYAFEITYFNNYLFQLLCIWSIELRLAQGQMVTDFSSLYCYGSVSVWCGVCITPY